MGLGEVDDFRSLNRIFGGSANGADILVVLNDVIFTTVAEWATDTAATSTRVGRKEAEKAGKCCIFYNIWHDSLDFITELIYNKA